MDPLEGGSSLMIAYRLKDLDVLVIGGGYEATSRCRNALDAQAKIHLISPKDEINKTLAPVVFQDPPVLTHYDRHFQPTDLDMKSWAMVLSCLEPEEEDEARTLTYFIYNECKRRKIPVNCADVVPCCDFWFMSNFRQGPLQVAISTNGKAPGLSRRIKKTLEDSLEPGSAQAVEKVGRLREMLKEAGVEQSQRIKFMAKLQREWSMERLATLKDSELMELSKKVQDGSPLYEILGPRQPFVDTISSLMSKLSVNTTEKQRVVLLGAGPGDVGLLTLKAASLLQSADIVVSDRLIPQEILNLIPKDKLMMGAQKSGTGKSDEAQGETNDLVFEALANGARTVVRLKNGDPYLYGRGGEELLLFQSKGYQVEVVPGVSNVTAAPVSAGHPTTHRGVADQVLILTGRGEGGSMPDIPPYQSKRTLLILMGLGRLTSLVELMLQQGYPSELGISVVEKASCPDQRQVDATLSTIGSKLLSMEPPLSNPATIIVGNVVGCLNMS